MNRTLMRRDRTLRTTTAMRSVLLLAVAVSLPSVARAQDAISGGQVELDTIVVRDEGASTEGTESYTTVLTTAGGKDEQEIREIPQTVNIVTQQRIEDLNMTTLEDGAQWTPGLRVFRNDQGRSSIFSRGFEFDSFYVDGLWAPLNSAYGFQPDLAPFERIEFLKGPAALFAGSGEPGGTANLVRKRGLDEFGVTATAHYGSWQDGRGEIDITGPFNAEKTVRGRAVVAYQDAENFVDVNEAQVGVAYGTVDIDFTENTTLSVGAWYQERDMTPNNALPTRADGALLNVDRSTFLGADWNTFENNSTDVVAELEHRFDSGGHARLAARYTDRYADGKYAFSAGAPDAAGNVNLRAAALEAWQEAVYIDGYVSKPFEVYGLEQNVIVGADYKRLDQTANQGGAMGFAMNNIYAPNPNVIEPTIPWSSETKMTPEETGLYGQLRLKPVEPLTFVLGGRAAWYENNVTDLIGGGVQSIENDGEISPYAGVVYDLNEYFSLYASYTESWQPQTELNAAGNVLPARSSKQYESGIKGSFLDGLVNTSLAIFKIEDHNRAIANPVVPGTYFDSGRIDVSGLEAEISGSPLPGWELFAGYTYLNMKYLEDSATLSYRYYLPQHTFNLWSKYTFQEGALEHLSLAGGLTAVSSFHNVFGPLTIRENGYVTVDAQVGYQFTENVSATLTVTNLFDETYYERIGVPATFNFYGAPRAVMAEVKATF